MVALFISRNAESTLNLTSVLLVVSIQKICEETDTHHIFASDVFDPIGPTKLIGDVLDFTTLKREGLVSSIHVLRDD